MDIDDPRLEQYIEEHSSPQDELLVQVQKTTREQLGHEGMIIGPLAGRLLELLVWAGRPQRVLELGTFSGYSALSMAAGLPPSGRIDTCELDAGRAAIAQAHFDASPHGSKITLHVGPALDTIAQLDGDFDFVLIDADKEGYIDYYEAVLPRLSPHGLIAADNTLRPGSVLDGTALAMEFNDHVARDPRSVQVMLTVRDGLTLIRAA
jgi:caffeoyl-CoA O-methyltransferase